MNVFLVDSRIPESPGASIGLYPASRRDPTKLAGLLSQLRFSRAHLPILSGTTPLTLTAARRKRNSEALQEVQTYRARQGEHGDHDGLVDQVYKKRVSPQRQQRPRNERCLVRQAHRP